MGKKFIKLRCQRCKRVWDYTGDKLKIKTYVPVVSCPDCRTSVMMREYVPVGSDIEDVKPDA